MTSNGKGGNFEREISKKLSLWLTNGEDEDTVWRSKCSGGRSTRRLKNNQKTNTYDFGDLCPDGPKSQWFFDIFNGELKSGYLKTKGKKLTTLWSDLDIVDSSQNKPILIGFWEQTINESIESKREPLLIFRRPHREACIVMQDYVFEVFTNYNRVNFNIIQVWLESYKYPIIICNINAFFNYTWGIWNEKFKKKIKKVIKENN